MPLGALASPPAGMLERPLRVIVEDMDGLEPLTPGKYRDDGTYPVTRAILGVPHVFVDDVDVTYLRGERTLIREYVLVEPFGEDSATVEFPQISPFDILGETGEELSFIGPDRDIEIVIVEEGVTPGVFNGTQHSVWNGILVSDESDVTEDSASMSWHAKGLLIGQASSQQHRVVNYMEPTDIGTVIPAALNAVSSRRFEEIDPVVTGIMTRERGAETDKVADYVQDLLSRAWTDEGRQWTIVRTGSKTYEMVLKDNTTIDYTLEAGTRGVSASLKRDKSQSYNVIWGRGVRSDGYSWRGMVYPNFQTDDTLTDADLDGTFRFPLIFDPKVNDGSLTPDGEPAVEYDPEVEREDVEINFPPGTGKDAAYLDAARQLAREENAGATGTIRLRTDPVEGSRYLMQVGSNISYRGYRGGDFSTDFEPFLLHIAEMRVDLAGKEIELTVDSRWRDAMTLSSIMQRDREASLDPARRPGNVNRRSRAEPDVAVEFDGEAADAAVAIEHEVADGVWHIFPLPVFQTGRIVKLEWRSTGRFALALFGAPITPSELAALVPDPLAVEDPFKEESEALAAAGIIEGWGRLDDAAGYSPGQESAGDSFTGLLLDTNTIEFSSARPPWVWVCEWSDGDHTFSGQLFPDVNK